MEWKGMGTIKKTSIKLIPPQKKSAEDDIF